MYVAYDATIGRIYNVFTTDDKSAAESLLLTSFENDFAPQNDVTMDYLESIGLELHDIGDMSWLHTIQPVGYGNNILTRITTEFEQRCGVSESIFIDYLRMQYIIGYLRVEFKTDMEIQRQNDNYRYHCEYIAEHDDGLYVHVGLISSRYGDDSRYRPQLEISVPVSELHLRDQEPMTSELLEFDLDTIIQELGLQ